MIVYYMLGLAVPNRKRVHVQVSTQKPGLTDVERIKHSVSYESCGKVLERLALKYYRLTFQHRCLRKSSSLVN